MIRFILGTVAETVAFASAVGFGLYLGLTQAFGQTIEPDETGPCIGRLLITNLETGITEQTTTHDVGGIEVGVIYHSTPNWTFDTDPRDIITVTTPEGYMAVPSEIILDENATAEVLICEALIG